MQKSMNNKFVKIISIIINEISIIASLILHTLDLLFIGMKGAEQS